jgi:hypothetical protein
MSEQLIRMKSPNNVVYAIKATRAYAHMTKGWTIVDRAEQARHSARLQRINASLVVHSD